jgi:PBSX family phage terminase large subunit
VKTAARSTPSRKYRGAAADLIASREPEVVTCGPAGTGKSLAALHKMHRAAIKYPGMRGLIVRKTRESLTQAGLVTLEDKAMSPHWRDTLARNCQRRVRQSYVYPNGSEVVVGGLDKPGKVMSTEYDLVYVQEAIDLTEADWESLSSRIRNGVMPYQQLYGDTNPDAPTHWLKQRADSGLVRLLESRHEDNPAYWGGDGWTDAGEAYIARLDRLTGTRYLRLRKGIWAGAEGVIYGDFDPAVHVIDRMPAGWESWYRFRSIDFGYTNPFVCQWWAIDGDGRMYLYREAYLSGRIVADHAADIKRLERWTLDDGVTPNPDREAVPVAVADHDAEDRATLARGGIGTKPAHKAVTPGIQAVEDRLRLAGDGKPRIFFLKDCRARRDPSLVAARKPTCTVEEFPGYIWAPPRPGRAPKEEPVKVNDHGMDAMRYAVMSVDCRRVLRVSVGDE